MIENKDDTLEINFVLEVIKKEEWVTEEILLMYEECYRRLHKLAKTMGLDTMELDMERDKVMKLYNQL